MWVRPSSVDFKCFLLFFVVVLCFVVVVVVVVVVVCLFVLWGAGGERGRLFVLFLFVC